MDADKILMPVLLWENKPFDVSPFGRLFEGYIRPKRGGASWDEAPEELYERLAIHILTVCEGFERIEKVPKLKGIPFDYLGNSQQITYQGEGFCHSGMVLAGIQPREKTGFRLEDCRNDGGCF